MHRMYVCTECMYAQNVCMYDVCTCIYALYVCTLYVCTECKNLFKNAYICTKRRTISVFLAGRSTMTSGKNRCCMVDRHPRVEAGVSI
jgi:hypothetical protein